jgi:hypothetical protein
MAVARRRSRPLIGDRMPRRALALLFATAVSIAAPVGVANAAGASPVKTPSGPKTGKLRLCTDGSPMAVYVDGVGLHRAKEHLADGACVAYRLPKGKYAVTVVGSCTNNASAALTGARVEPARRALYNTGGDGLAGARVKAKRTTIFAASWSCRGETASPGGPGLG